ncbi:FMN-dependent NADH-azoreductase [Novosphingobium gossypii]|uniref:FMN-dependent NADH-azoreductase n=1 Tax=Novosphingobium gossypii TaxID=1604774 RepID=UPI003D21074F
MIVLHIDCSSRASSHSRQLSASVVERLKAMSEDATILRRDLGCDPIPHIGAGHADSLSSAAAMAAADSAVYKNLSDPLIDELERADVVVIGTPMHNFTIPSVLKAWVDQVLRAGRTIVATAEGKTGSLSDRPVFIAVASGGVFTGERANQPDFLTPYLDAALDCIGLTSVHYLALQGTAFTDDQFLAERKNALVAEADTIICSDVRLTEKASRGFVQGGEILVARLPDRAATVP